MTELKPHFSTTRRAGDFVFVSGQLPFDDDMNIVSGGIEVQTRRCLELLQSAFKSEGLTLADAVKITVWISNPDDFAVFNETYAEYFPGVPPVRTTLGATLVVPGALIEMDGQAWMSPA